MLHVCCVKWGTMYGPEYINTLFDMVRRNLPAGFAGRFVCLTDDPTGLDEGIDTAALPAGVLGWWAKLALFRAGAFPRGERVLYFDLDTIITGPLDAIAAYTGDFAILRDVYRPQGLQSSVMAWEAGGRHRQFWELWHRRGCPMDERGDQGFIEDALDLMPSQIKFIDRWQDLFPGRFRSYKVECREEIPPGTSVVFFHGHPRPHEVKAGWVPEVWKVGGGSGAEIVARSNVKFEELRRNVTAALKRGCQWLVPAYRTETAVIVGGGPSLTDNLYLIRGMQLAGAQVYATGNTYRYLRDHGIKPDAHVLLDARQANLEFIPSETGPKYYASQCHPDVLEAAGSDLICWHAAGTTYQPLIEHHQSAQLGGGTTVGLKAIALTFALGHRHLRLFGFDSCYGESHHAYPQNLNDSERTVNYSVAGRTFKCAPWMVVQAEDFKAHMPLYTQLGCVVRIYGDGLISHIASLFKIAVQERAEQLLDWLQDTPEPIGVEVGVFTGALSQLLLERPDLRLYMVDHWLPADPQSEYAHSGDFHAKLSGEQQTRYMHAAIAAVQFAGERAQIVRLSSVNAAEHVLDHSLDFVFIDADHSYEGCKADIEAWLPKIKPSGFISGHDYDNTEFPDFGVKRAVDEFFGTPERGANFTWRVPLTRVSHHERSASILTSQDA
jgi:Protein of unknown function DUF115/Methyltransferase domain